MQATRLLNVPQLSKFSRFFGTTKSLNEIFKIQSLEGNQNERSKVIF